MGGGAGIERTIQKREPIVMDYEKKYKEALVTVKKLCGERILHLPTMQKAFPELRESEDERIRKVLIECAKHSIFRNLPLHGFSIDKIIAFLEKQKEQEPITDSIKFEEGFKAGREFESREQKDFRKLYEDIAKSEWFKKAYEGKSLGELASSASWKDDEQKPMEKQDYSGLSDFERAIHRGFLCAGVKNVPRVIIEETAKDCLAQIKPVEWSEEEHRMLDSIEKIIYCCIEDSPVGFTQEYLKDLGFFVHTIQKKSNRENWSEEDDKTLQSILRDYEYAIQSSGTIWGKDFEKKHYWLESLRPQPCWKPSEKQMDALTRATNRCVSTKDVGPLMSLYNDLKKLCQ